MNMTGRRLAAALKRKNTSAADVEVGGAADDDKNAKHMGKQPSGKNCTFLKQLVLFIITISAIGPVSFYIMTTLHPAFISPTSAPADNNCLTLIRSFLTVQEIGDTLDTLLCSASLPVSSSLAGATLTTLADLVIRDRSELRRLERREYLRDLRSYRLSGLICNDHLDKSMPPVNSEPAFKCLTNDYKRRACMDGRVGSPAACNAYGGGDAPYIPEPERKQIQQQTSIDNYPQECRDLSSEGVEKCGENFMTYGGTTDEGQLAAGVPEAKVLTQSKMSRPVWRKESLDFHLNLIQQGKNVGPLHYPGSHQALQKSLETIGVKGRSVAIFGSISPWVESIVHHNDAKSPTKTVDYNHPISFDDRMETELMSTMLEGGKQFDIIISYSSIEHDGQGRYGDPLDPDGDLAAMKECWLKVKPGGYFLIGVPWGEDGFYWISEREYGLYRLPVLIRGWEYRGVVTSKMVHGPKDTFKLWDVANDSPILVLRKPESVGVHDVLDTSKFGGFSCDTKSKTCGIFSQQR